jgi:uncharacterized protein YegP (UPF0339 family)
VKATVYPASDGWRWRMIADNGEIVATGEAYVQRQDAEDVLGLLIRTVDADVTVRGHGDEVTAHYKLTRWGSAPTTEGNNTHE